MFPQLWQTKAEAGLAMFGNDAGVNVKIFVLKTRLDGLAKSLVESKDTVKKIFDIDKNQFDTEEAAESISIRS